MRAERKEGGGHGAGGWEGEGEREKHVHFQVHLACGRALQARWGQVVVMGGQIFTLRKRGADKERRCIESFLSQRKIQFSSTNQRHHHHRHQCPF